MTFLVNDVAMVIFFGLITKEVVEATARGGALHPWRRALLPVIASIGATAVPALFYMNFVDRVNEPMLALGRERSVSACRPSERAVPRRTRSDAAVGIDLVAVYSTTLNPVGVAGVGCKGYSALTPAMSSASSVRFAMLQSEEIEGYMVAFVAIEWPSPSAWPNSCEAMSSM